MEDMEDLVMVFERRKRDIAREIVTYATPWLQELPPWRNTHGECVLA